MRPLALKILGVLVLLLTITGCGASSRHSGYSALAKSEYTAACTAGANPSAPAVCRCTLLWAEAHKVPRAQLAAVTSWDQAGSPNGSEPEWIVTAAGSC